MEINKIIQDNALEVLKTFSDESINCVMTSPPYWALRDYGSSVETIWDGKEDCEHKWRIEEFKQHSGRGDSQKSAKYSEQGLIPDMKLKRSFCSKCNAWKGQLGLEPTFDLYIKHLCDIFDEVKRVLRKDGTCFVNLGDTYYSVSGGKFLNDNLGSKERNELKGLSNGNELKKGKELEQKNLCNIPARFSIEMQNRGWILRNVIIWHKPNCMPSSIKDRFTVDFEYLFFFVKNQKYWFETQYEPISKSYANDKRPNGVLRQRLYANSKYVKSGMIKKEDKSIDELKNRNLNGRNKRAVWSICPKPFKESHFAVYPEELCETPIKAGCPEFICNKCGKAREKIIEHKNNERTRKTGEGQDTEIGTRGRAGSSNILEIGYSNCNCNAGFSGGIVLDPFFGAGTTGLVALKQNKKFIGIELNSEYIKIAEKRLKPFLEQQKLI